ncbi:MAG: hypothetical protein AB8B71_07105 [Paracoccaceae bacterium]
MAEAKCVIRRVMIVLQSVAIGRLTRIIALCFTSVILMSNAYAQSSGSLMSTRTVSSNSLPNSERIGALTIVGVGQGKPLYDRDIRIPRAPLARPLVVAQTAPETPAPRSTMALAAPIDLEGVVTGFGGRVLVWSDIARTYWKNNLVAHDGMIDVSSKIPLSFKETPRLADRSGDWDVMWLDPSDTIVNPKTVQTPVPKPQTEAATDQITEVPAPFIGGRVEFGWAVDTQQKQEGMKSGSLFLAASNQSLATLRLGMVARPETSRPIATSKVGPN